MKYAVIKTGGKQYKVAEKEILEVEKLTGIAKDKVVFDQVLLVVDDKKVSIGQPLVKGAKVTASIVEQKKGVKVRVAKFKSKSKYRRVMGHRQLLTTINIVKISLTS